MSSPHIGFEQQQVLIRFQFAQSRHPFGRFPIRHPRICEPTNCEDMRIGFCSNIIDRRIRSDIAICRSTRNRVAPFRPFRRCQRKRIIQHCGQHINERNLGNDAVEKLWRQVADDPHQHAARTAALGHNFSTGCKFCINQMLGNRNEIFERIHLVLKLAILIPSSALLLPTANMSNRIDKTAIDQ